MKQLSFPTNYMKDHPITFYGSPWLDFSTKFRGITFLMVDAVEYLFMRMRHEAM